MGTVKEDLVLRDRAGNRTFSVLELEVNQKSETGELEKETLHISLWEATAKNTARYAGKGSTIMIRGRVVNRVLDYFDEGIRTVGIIGEHVSFIQTKTPGTINQTDDIEEKAHSVNQVSLIGRTVRDVELQKNPEGRAYADVTIATTRSFKNKATETYDADFIRVKLWDLEAESVAKNVGKGSAISIQGYIKSKTASSLGMIAMNVVGDKVATLQLKAPQKEHQISNDQNETDVKELVNIRDAQMNLDL